jgi:hypothetical protein
VIACKAWDSESMRNAKVSIESGFNARGEESGAECSLVSEGLLVLEFTG